MRRAKLATKCLASNGTSTCALAQRRHLNRKDVETIEEVGPERAAAHVFVQVPVGRRNHPDVDLRRLRRAEPLELLLLQDAQQLHLDVGRQLPDFVEENRPVVRELEPAFLLLDRAGERALSRDRTTRSPRGRPEARRN